MQSKLYRLFITPQTKINISDNERWIPHKDDAYLLQCGIKRRAEQIQERRKRIDKETYYITRKKRMLRYFEYKKKLKLLGHEAGLIVFPTDHVWFRFYLPMPKSWSKKKRNELAFTKHESTPDASNMHKALEDSFSIGDRDKINWDYRATKFWYPGDEGFIEIDTNCLPPAKGYAKPEREDKIK